MLSASDLISVARPSATPATMAVMMTHSTAEAPRLGAVRARWIRTCSSATV
ncbi:hypothetical protein ACFSTC_49865 [Nonomuraea ferruginea]